MLITFVVIVYLSASVILKRDYNSQRLQTDVLAKYSLAMTNMWPYLRIRAAEAARRKCIYAATFLPRFFARLGCPSPVAERLCACPDHPLPVSYSSL